MDSFNSMIGSLHQDTAFELAFRLRTPQPAKPKGCVVLLHGVGGSEMSLAGLAGSIDPELMVVLAQAPLPLAPQQFAWFRVAFTEHGPSIVAAEAERSRQLLIRFVAQLQSRYGIAPQNTLIAGFSQGGIMSASVALSTPESVLGFAVLCGRILPELEPHLAPPSRLASLQAFIGHGEYDSKLPVQWAQRADRWLTQLKVSHQLRLYPVEHSISEAMQADFVKWLDACLSGKSV
ncbi:alpha/beta hydrolase [Marinobacterium arenosum]|uniref:alpha/beta hydrolase n=1 Tax=Marinobacterium arenosum TaxID=2862496 RepID=UPI001C96FF76|nr:phospholipase [Marinobacterium arenosum]MBY4676688.1 phospholipase [Marinobacterium arenosum]